MALTRRPDWQPRLHAWLVAAGRRQIVPGEFDCCLFGAGAVDAQTGVDLAAGYRGRYATFTGGQRVLRKAGFRDHVDLLARNLREDHPGCAREGDIAIIPTPDGDAVGVCQGSAVYVLAPSGGLGFAPVSAVQRLFKVD